MSSLSKLPHGVSLDIDEETRARVDVNLRLLQRFIDMVVADPSVADDIPAEANVIFLPDDDEEVARRHEAAGLGMREAGAVVHFVRV